ncbi:MAG: transporter substrate-binding domain-containing protein [Thermovirgaceae bacterium]
MPDTCARRIIRTGRGGGGQLRRDAFNSPASSALPLAAALLILTLICSPAAAQTRTVTVSTSYKSLLSTPEQTGMLDLLVKEAFKRIGLEAEVVFNPTGRSLEDVNEGLFDVEINRIKGMEKEYPNLVMVPEHNMVMRFVAFSKEDLPIDGWDSLRGLRIGVVKGWRILEENTRGFPDVTLVPTETELFNMLDRDRIDVALYDELTGYEQISLRRFKGMRHLEPPLAGREMHLYLHARIRDLVEPLSEALGSMKEDGTYDRIVRQATSHLVIDSGGKDWPQGFGR